MSNQDDLFPPYQRHSSTSFEAAASVIGRAGTLRRRVYEQIWRSGRSGMTDEEIQDALGMNPSTERPRRIELMDKKAVIDSGRTRLTKSRRSAVVWIAATNAP